MRDLVTPWTRVRRLTQRFGENAEGNIAILFTVMAAALFFFVGGAVDYSRMSAVRADMIEAMDAAGLAVARLATIDDTLSEAELTEYGEKFFAANFHQGKQVGDLSITFDYSDKAVIKPCVNGRLDTYLLRIVHIEKFDMDTCVEITKQGSGRVELALVLDVTGSMGWYDGGEKKIVSLRNAVNTLLDVMYGADTTSDNVKIGIVPFNAYVNPGGASSWLSTWGDLNAQAYYHGARFIHVDENGDVDMDTKVNHYRLFDTVTNSEWMGCVEARPYPLDELDVPVGGSITASEISNYMAIPTEYQSGGSPEALRMYDAYNDAPNLALSTSILTNSANFKWAPLFAEDGIDCDANWRGRCPYYYGNSYWTSTEVFDIGGASHSQDRWRSWFTDPSYDGHNDGSYYNRTFLDDELYIGRYAGEPAGRYAKIVEDFRNLDSGGLTTDEQNWRDMMIAYGANEFYDANVTSPSDGSTANYDEYMLRHAYVGWWDPNTETYKYKYDLNTNVDESISDSDNTMYGPNGNCPAPILPLTNDRDEIETHMTTLFANGNTNSANGAIWGWRVLSPEAPFTEGIGPSDENYGAWQKAVVIMTDGENTTSNANTHFGSDLTSYGYAVESRMGLNMNDANDMEAEYDNKLLRICHRMKEEGILVYTIMFALSSSATEQTFKACATEPNPPYFHDAVDATDLEDAFGEIAADLVDLHISG